MAQHGRGPATGQGPARPCGGLGADCRAKLRPRGCPGPIGAASGVALGLAHGSGFGSQAQARRGEGVAGSRLRRQAMQPLAAAAHQVLPGAELSWRRPESAPGRPGSIKGWVEAGLAASSWGRSARQEAAGSGSRRPSRSAKPRAASSSRAFCKGRDPACKGLVGPGWGSGSGGVAGCLAVFQPLPASRLKRTARRCQWRTAGHFAHICVLALQPARRCADGPDRTPDQHCATAKPIASSWPAMAVRGKGQRQPQQVGWAGIRPQHDRPARRRED